MPITDVLIRSLSGYIFVIPGILLSVFKKIGEKANSTPYRIRIYLLLLSYWSPDNDRYREAKII